jgi:hypothetical protein
MKTVVSRPLLAILLMVCLGTIHGCSAFRAGWIHGWTLPAYQGRLLSTTTEEGQRALRIQRGYNTTVHEFVADHGDPTHLFVEDARGIWLLYAPQRAVHITRGTFSSGPAQIHDEIPKHLIALLASESEGDGSSGGTSEQLASTRADVKSTPSHNLVDSVPMEDGARTLRAPRSGVKSAEPRAATTPAHQPGDIAPAQSKAGGEPGGVPLVLPSASFAWQKACDSGKCRIYTYTDVRQPGESEPVRMLLEVSDARDVLLTALNTRAYHQQFYSTKPPTHILLNRKEYVPARFQFNEHFPGSLTIDGKRIATLAVRNQSQLKAQSDKFDAIADALRIGNLATIEYASNLRGKGQKTSFSLAGFTRAFASLVPGTGTQAVSKRTDPIFVLKPLLAGNRFSVGVRDLRVKQNPYGSGAFVYAPETRYFGVERLFVWFVKNDTALKLNGATDNLTPSLPFPRDAALDFWEGTGLSEATATSRGLDVAFGR